MPRGWRIGSLVSVAAYIALAGTAAWLVLGRGASPPRFAGQPPSPRGTPDGRWQVVESDSYAHTSVTDVNGIQGELEVHGRQIRRAHLSGSRASFDLSRPVDLRTLREGKEEAVEIAGEARVLFVSRTIRFDAHVLWQGNRMRMRAGGDAASLQVVLRRA